MVLTARPSHLLAQASILRNGAATQDPQMANKPGTVNDPDAPLVRRVGKGDTRAATKLVQRHLPKITALARHMLGDASEAEDVAQEVFLKVWQNAGKWEPGRARFETWIHRVAINLCYDRLRRRREVYLDTIPDREDEDSQPADQNIIDLQTKRRIEAAMKQLPDRQRAALTLCHLREISNIDAASIMEISVEALESLLARGRRGLRRQLFAEAKMLLEK